MRWIPILALSLLAIACGGDDTTDEDAFRSLRGIGRSIRVGSSSGPSLADYTLPDPEAVLQLLRWLSAGAFKGTGR